MIFGALGMGNGQGASGTGVLANISLQAAGVGSSPLNLHDVDLVKNGGDSKAVAVQDGSVAVERTMDASR